LFLDARSFLFTVVSGTSTTADTEVSPQWETGTIGAVRGRKINRGTRNTFVRFAPPVGRCL
jgi:hypothetical protein